VVLGFLRVPINQSLLLDCIKAILGTIDEHKARIIQPGLLGRILDSANPKRNPPELGSFAHFLQTAANSGHRRETSALIRRFLLFAAECSGSTWLLDPQGAQRITYRMQKGTIGGPF
jgi:hypothetical protein